LVHAALAVLGTGAWYTALTTLDTGVAVFAGRAEMLVIVGLGALLLGERLRWLEILGAVVAIAGLTLMCLPGDGSDGVRIEVLWILLGAVGFGSGEILAKVALREIDANTFVLGRSVLLALAWVGIALARDGATVPAPYVLLAAAAAALLGPVGARILYMHALRTLTVSRAALVAQVHPLCAALVAFAVLGERLSAREWLGGLVLLAGTVLIVRGARPSVPAAPPAGD
jgi:probable blue pigment (indigoidine) exporter